MDLFHELIFDGIIEGLNKIADKLREKRPEDAPNGTLAEWIVLTCIGFTMLAYFVWIFTSAQENGDTRMVYIGILLIVLLVVLVAMVLLRRFVRKRKDQADSEERLR